MLSHGMHECTQVMYAKFRGGWVGVGGSVKLSSVRLDSGTVHIDLGQCGHGDILSGYFLACLAFHWMLMYFDFIVRI